MLLLGKLLDDTGSYNKYAKLLKTQKFASKLCHQIKFFFIVQVSFLFVPYASIEFWLMSVQSGIIIKSGFKVNSNLFISLDSGGHVIGAYGP